MTRGFSAALAAIAMAASAASAIAQQVADLVLRNASIWTADPDRTDATALAVRDGRIVFIGDDAEAYIGDATRVIDAEGRRVLPGLIDAHVHIAGAAASFDSLDLRVATSRDDLLNIVREGAEQLPEDAWVVGRGWSAESWPDRRPPSAEEIDEAAGGRPAVLVRMDGHSLIAGATALEMAGVTTDGPADPAGGEIGRRADGAPDGALYEQAMGLVTRLVPERDDVRTMDLIRRASAHANSLGVTQVGAIDSRRTLENLVAPLDAAGKLTLRVNASVSEGHDSLAAWRPTLEWAADNPQLSPRVRVLGFKGYMDGSLGSRTAWMFEPYLDNPADRGADNAGFPLALAASGELEAIIRLGADMGLQPIVHAIGARANSVLLDWYAKLPGSVRDQIRPRIEHAQHLTPMDAPRFGALGVVPSMQPYHKADDGRYALDRLGPARNRTSYAFRQLLDTGAVLAFGSDWPVVTVDPMLGIHAAVTARTLDGATFVPEQSISVADALRAYTTGAAWALHSEAETGMLREGYAADFIILDRDILAIDPSDIPQVRVLRTVIAGDEVFTRDDE
ncbi:MAG: amidohydrolase [Phycisphaerales bacterium]